MVVQYLSMVCVVDSQGVELLTILEMTLIYALYR